MLLGLMFRMVTQILGAHMCCNAGSHAHTYTRTHTHSLSPSHCLSPTHTHTITPTQSPTQSPTHQHKVQVRAMFGSRKIQTQSTLWSQIFIGKDPPSPFSNLFIVICQIVRVYMGTRVLKITDAIFFDRCYLDLIDNEEQRV